MLLKMIKLLLFMFLFIIKFSLFKCFKYILKITIITKILHVLIYYILNLYIYILIYIKHLNLKFIMFIYFKFRINILYFFNMFIHYKLLKIITKLFLYDAYYLNSELIDDYPYYSSKYFINFYTWLSPITPELYNKKFIKIFRLFFNFLISFINIIFYIIFNILSYYIKFLYFIIIGKTKIIKIILFNKNNFILFFYL